MMSYPSSGYLFEPGRTVREQRFIFGLHEELIGVAVFLHLDLRKIVASKEYIFSNGGDAVGDGDAGQGSTVSKS